MKIENISLKHHITIDPKTLQKFNYVMDSNYDKEFTAFCHAEKRENGEYHIYDIFFPRQDNASTTTECDSDDIMALIPEGLDISKLGGHGHSHSNMSVFASGTDKKDIIERAEHSGWNAAFIGNKKGELFGHIADLDLGIYIEKVPIKINYPFTKEEYEEGLISLVKLQDNIIDMKTVLSMTTSDYYGTLYPLTTEETDFLDMVIKDRFKNKYNTNPVKNKKKNNKVTQADVLKSIGNNTEYVQKSDDFYGYGYPMKAEDYFEDDELKIIEGAKLKSYHDLTEEEFTLLYEYENYFQY